MPDPADIVGVLVFIGLMAWGFLQAANYRKEVENGTGGESED